MRFIAECFRRIHYFINWRRLDRELQQEMESHREMMDEPARFGNTLRLREESRDAWGLTWLDDLSKDLKYGVRQLVKARAFTILSLATLAIGIGANTALFSVLNSLLFEEPPVRHPELLRQIEWAEFQPGIEQFGWTNYAYPVYRQVSARSTSFSDVLCLKYGVAVNVRYQGAVERGSADFVSGNFLQALGARQVRGRLLMPDDDRPNATPVTVIDDYTWQKLFGGDTAIIGQTVTLNGMVFTVVGVMPEKFEIDTRNLRGRSGGRPVFRVPISHLAAMTGSEEALASTTSPCRMIGILRPGIESEQARLETERLVREAFATYTPIVRSKGAAEPQPADAASVRVGLRRVGRGIDEITLRDARREAPAVLSILLLPWAILLIPCANIAGMSLARAAARRGEIATRLAIGASRRRLIRQLLTESVLLAVFGSVIAVFLCYIASRFALVFEFPFLLDIRVLALSAGLAITTGLVIGLVPALTGTRVDLNSVARQESAGIQGRSNMRVGKALVGIQVTLSFLLLITGGLQVRSLMSLTAVDIPEPERVLMLGIDGRSSEHTPEQIERFLQEGTARLQQLPGVISAATAGMGVGRRTTRDFTSIDLHVGPGYFEIMDVPLQAGRDLQWQDSGQDVVVVNEAFVRKYLPERNPLGVTLPGYGRIVGVVANSRAGLGSALSVGAGVEPTAYLPPTRKVPFSWILVRVDRNASALISPARRVMGEVNAAIPLGEIHTLAEEMAFAIKERSLIVTVFMAFGMIALLQAACGIYGTMSYVVHRRTPEIGLRMALGAQRYDVLGLVIRQSIVPVLLGLILGTIATPLLTLAMESNGEILVGRTSPADQAAIIGSVVLLVLATTVAAWSPALRASRIDPMHALRHE